MEKRSFHDVNNSASYTVYNYKKWWNSIKNTLAVKCAWPPKRVLVRMTFNLHACWMTFNLAEMSTGRFLA